MTLSVLRRRHSDGNYGVYESNLKKKLQRTLQRLKKVKRSNSSKQQCNVSSLPSLDMIYYDGLMLNALIRNMGNSYNAENILFILSVKHLKTKTEPKEIMSTIQFIYSLFIDSSAAIPINLSHFCFVNIRAKVERLGTFSNDEMRCIFDLCVDEIEHLINTSILSSFYRSALFHKAMKKKSKKR